MKNRFQPPKSEWWTGRKIDPALGTQYWYQAVTCQEDENELSAETDVTLLGYACDEGVRRNLGRVGAVAGPSVIRERLGKLAWHHGNLHVVDLGNVTCADGKMERTQKEFSSRIARCVEAGVLPIGLGGGHDIAYATGSGVLMALPRTEKLGIVNFDAHFDLRSVAEQGNSGTPFKQLFDEFGKERINYHVLGLQQVGNTPSLFETAEEVGADWVDVHGLSSPHVQQYLEALVEDCDKLYITVDMDGFSSAFAPGVSAASPVGLTPDFVYNCIRVLMESGKVVALDIAELNPNFDQDNQTAVLAARVVEWAVRFLN